MGYTTTVLINIYGNASVQFPISLMNGSYYIAIRHRNAMETWSKFPIFINSNPTNFDFTQQ